MNRELVVVPDSRLRRECKPIENIDESIQELAKDMLAYLTPTKSLGFAAPQFGELVRLIVLRVRGLEVALVNPEIVKTRGEQRVIEGCRSIPRKLFGLKRPKLVKVRGLGLDGKVRSVKGHDLLAQVLMHEVNHLDGILIDKIGIYLGQEKEGIEKHIVEPIELNVKGGEKDESN